MIAVMAILVESYRSLKAQKLFKTVLVLSLLVIIGFASFGFNEKGMSLFFGAYTIESEFLNSESEYSKTLYLGIFSAFIVNLWLAWVATILALISTSSIFPTFLSEGAVEMVMSKSVRRTTLFLSKYIGGLLFVILQVSVFCVGAFLVAGWRVGEWNVTIFLAIPLVTIFFSYLFCVNVLFGVLTRSTLVALLFTLLFWFMTFGVRQADDILHIVWFQGEVMAVHYEQELEEDVQNLATYKSTLESMKEGENTESGLDYYSGQIKRTESNMEYLQNEVDERRRLMSQLDPWVTTLNIIRWPLPETSRTIGLLQRWIDQGRDVTMVDIMSGKIFEEDEQVDDEVFRSDQEAQKKLIGREQEISAGAIIGWSLLFEFVILVLAWWVFVRRDY
ncbi:MAG: hypothetical protein P8M22_06445 [Phycisphaerales bacterium]|nr:hypothetical protein [Phycisphaerales bacterium]